MRKLRNPRYAPEFLERKLSPSTMTVMPTTVSIAPTTTTTTLTVVSTDPTSTTTSIDYPPPPPPPPTGPLTPA